MTDAYEPYIPYSPYTSSVSTAPAEPPKHEKPAKAAKPKPAPRPQAVHVVGLLGECIDAGKDDDLAAVDAEVQDGQIAYSHARTIGSWHYPNTCAEPEG